MNPTVGPKTYENNYDLIDSCVFVCKNIVAPLKLKIPKKMMTKKAEPEDDM